MIPTTIPSSARAGLLMRLGAGSLLLAAAALTISPARAEPQPGTHGAQHAAMHRMGPGLHGGLPMVPERMLDAVGASAEQKARLRDIYKAAGDEIRAQHENGRALRAQMLQLMAAPQVDAAAAEALRQKQLAQHDATSKRMLQAMLDAQAVLTPEQRAKLAERMAERQRVRHEHMHRHERRAPEAPKG
jgi:Spy/CpxP family protein refolding chaperone